MDMIALRKVRCEKPPKRANQRRKAGGKAAPSPKPALFDQQPEKNGEAVPESVSERPARFQVREMRLLPDNPFSDTSAECVRHFKEGNHYGCVALTQAVLEALVHHLWQVNWGKKKPQDGDFLTILGALHSKGVVKEECKAKLHEIWWNRHDFHHLRPAVDEDQQRLVRMAQTHLTLLEELKEAFFGYDIQGERVIPNHPEYWSIKEGEPLSLTSR
jgi:hypothetical protein